MLIPIGLIIGTPLFDLPSDRLLFDRVSFHPG
jgi:hypothetical protein